MVEVLSSGRRGVELAPFSPTRSWASRARRAATSPAAASFGALCAVAGLWLLTRAYLGIQVDARIYMGRAAADLAPATIGRDLMFIHDGQSPFSVYTLLARVAVAHLGVGAAGTVLAAFGVALWFAAMAFLATRIATGPLTFAVMACVAVLPAEYGGLTMIQFGESSAVPRAVAEACVLAALAMLIDGRRWAALAVLAMAAAFHPIMATCGFGVLFAVAVWEDRRWLIPGVCGAALVLVAAALRLPVANRLFLGVDPAWLDLLHRRNPNLFPASWPLSTWSQTATQLATVVIAAGVLQGRARRTFVAAAGVAVLGVALAWLGGDAAPDLLMLQVQPWRGLWLTAALGAMGAAVAAQGLWRHGRGGRLALAFLAAAWIAPGTPAALAASIIAIGLWVADLRPGGLVISKGIVPAAWTMTAAMAATWTVHVVSSILPILSTIPPPLTNADAALLAVHLETAFVAPLVLWLALSDQAWAVFARRWTVLPLGLALLGLGAARWDRVHVQARPGLAPDPTLVRLIASKPGPVAWLGGDVQPWFVAGRASWASDLQGASIVFSRPQALAWEGRMRRLIALDLAPRHMLEPFWYDVQTRIHPTAPAVQALCRTPDGPAWVIQPLFDGAIPGIPDNTWIWRPREPRSTHDDDGWRRISAYAVTRCGAPNDEIQPASSSDRAAARK